MGWEETKTLLLNADVEACRRLPLPAALAPMPDFRASVSPVNHGILDLPIPPFVNPLVIRCLYDDSFRYTNLRSRYALILHV